MPNQMKTTKKNNKMREAIIQSFLACLKEDEIPWHREWNVIGKPFNAITKTGYNGVNAFWLSYIQFMKGYNDPRWCTSRQANENGWKIKQGEKGTKIEFWSLYDKEKKEKVTSAEAEKRGKNLSQEEYLERFRPVSNTYTVFNGEQINGIDTYVPIAHELSEAQLLSARNTLISNMNVGFEEGGNEAYYSPLYDKVVLPEMERFESEYGYMSTLLHECAHATGAEHRLNRIMEERFGTPGYAREELRAEIASAFTAQTTGIQYKQNNLMENHKAYVKNWIQILENHPNELFAAIKEAEKISDYLIEKGEFLKERDAVYGLTMEGNDNPIAYAHVKETDNGYEYAEYVKSHQTKLQELKKDKEVLVINAFAGPGAGKSVSCMDICSELKKRGYNAEYVQEYAKELVYDHNMEMLDGSEVHQFEILKEQVHRMDRLYQDVDFIVTDSPVLLNGIYNNNPTPEYDQMIDSIFAQYNNFAYFVERDTSHFQKEGRIHDLQQSIEKDNEIKNMLKEHDVYFGTYPHNRIMKVVDNSIVTFNRINQNASAIDVLNKKGIEISGYSFEEKYVEFKAKVNQREYTGLFRMHDPEQGEDMKMVMFVHQDQEPELTRNWNDFERHLQEIAAKKYEQVLSQHREKQEKVELEKQEVQQNTEQEAATKKYPEISERLSVMTPEEKEGFIDRIEINRDYFEPISKEDYALYEELIKERSSQYIHIGTDMAQKLITEDIRIYKKEDNTFKEVADTDEDGVYTKKEDFDMYQEYQDKIQKVREMEDELGLPETMRVTTKEGCISKELLNEKYQQLMQEQHMDLNSKGLVPDQIKEYMKEHSKGATKSQKKLGIGK